MENTLRYARAISTAGVAMRRSIRWLCQSLLVCSLGCRGYVQELPDAATLSDAGQTADAGESPDGGGPDGGAADSGDTYLPWEGGAAYYAKWTRGPPSDPSYFPIAVWLQSEGNATKYAAIGVNLFIGLWQGPTDDQLNVLADAGMPAVADQSGVWASHLNDATIPAWRIPDDEPDNAQPDGSGGYGPCISPSTIVSDYQAIVAADATRPVYLNLGQGVAYDAYVGRGSACSGRLDMYAEYEKGADIVSFDIYPVNNTDGTTHGNLWYVAQGVDRLRQWSEYKKPVWNWIEVTGID